MGVGRFVAIILLIAATGCAHLAQRTGSPDGAPPLAPANLSRWLAQHPLAEGQEMAIAEFLRTERSSVHVVQIRHEEALHVHERHDLVALLSRGHGTLRLGSDTLTLEEGSVVAIPRGVPHAFINESRQPAAAFVVFSPPFDGTDTVPVTDHP